MAKDKLHKIEAKCRNKIISYSDAPIEVKKKWDRYNFEKGEFRAKYKELKSKYIS
jgi:hypothetical protein